MQITTGYAKGMKLVAPAGDKTRPTGAKVRAAVFNMLQDRMDGARVLDLFAGSGAMGIEAISRGARRVVFVEQAPSAAGALKQNLKELERRALAQDLEPGDVTLIQRDATAALAGLGRYGPFDIVYMDPPYAEAPAWLAANGETLSVLCGTGATLVAEMASAGGNVPPVPAAAWTFVKEKVYGDTMIVVWERV